MNSRIQQLRSILNIHNLDALYLSSAENIRYLSGFFGSNGHLIITCEDAILITDGRYLQQAAEQTRGVGIIDQGTSLSQAIASVLAKQTISRLGYESDRITDADARKMRAACENVEWVPLTNVCAELRLAKDEDEISCIKRAVRIADDALARLVEELKPGLSEAQIAARLGYYMADLGSERPAFDTIAVSGKRGALPHGTPSDRKVCKNEMLTLDFGAVYHGYCSDITRTIWFGTPSAQMQEIWNLVLAAQTAAKNAVKPGVSVAEIDRIHREVLTSAGYRDCIMHSLGHGVGLEIHEDPRVSTSCDTVLAPGMVITIEPGLYLPDVGGVRIEDMVLVTKTGFETLTQSPHHIQIL